MSLAGILEQSAAERGGFAALLSHKLNMLLMEDDIESEASHVSDRARMNYSRDSAPASLAFTEMRELPEGDGTGEDSLSFTIFNESDSGQGNWRGQSYEQQSSSPRTGILEFFSSAMILVV